MTEEDYNLLVEYYATVPRKIKKLGCLTIYYHYLLTKIPNGRMMKHEGNFYFIEEDNVYKCNIEKEVDFKDFAGEWKTKDFNGYGCCSFVEFGSFPNCCDGKFDKI